MAASCRFAAVGKSPLTGTAGESEAAGFFGPELKKAGFDAVVFRGRADTPVYLWVNDGKAEIKDATSISQLGSKEVEEKMRHPYLNWAQKKLKMPSGKKWGAEKSGWPRQALPE
ncbi:MAG: hypothetical protein JRE36_15810 [Deltaproteobacteria bacterium]|nr:hypothetical protein [Deltaproteobacteria bacterium]